MKNLSVNYSKGQVKIQEMAFVLVALFILFGIAILFYFSIRMSSLRQDVQSGIDTSAKEMVRRLSSSPEFAWTSTGCSQCLDEDKVFALKSMKQYQDFWRLDYIAVETIYPNKTGECNAANYPNCRMITLVKKNDSIGTPSSAFVSLCRYDEVNGINYEKCELGKIYASGAIKK